jgi:hypothetical protein
MLCSLYTGIIKKTYRGIGDEPGTIALVDRSLALGWHEHNLTPSRGSSLYHVAAVAQARFPMLTQLLFPQPHKVRLHGLAVVL